MRCNPRPDCPLCSSQGKVLYEAQHDRLFGTPGAWGHRCCTNPACGLIWLDPVPVEQDLPMAYARYFTHGPTRRRTTMLARVLGNAKRGYLANRFGYLEGTSSIERFLGLLPWFYPGRASELDFSVMWLAAPAGGKLLDVGAGDGWLVEQMNSLGWTAEGIDFDERAVAIAKERGLAMQAAGLREAGFEPDTFGAVTMSHCLEHVADPVEFLGEAWRVMKPGARISVATPNTRSWLHRRFGRAWFHLDPPRHLVLFDRTTLREALHRAGFVDIRTFTTVRDANGAWLGSRSIRSSGRYDMTIPPGMLMKVVARSVQFAEAVRRRVDPDAGEDVVGLAVKP